MADTKATSCHPVTGWRLPPDLVRRVKLDATERKLRYSEVVRERLEESFRMRPVGIEPSTCAT